MKKRLLALLLTITMLVSLFPIPALATETEADTGLCPHHQEHTVECGYIAPAEGQPCGHAHTAECYTQGILPDGDSSEYYEISEDAENLPDCQHEHDGECGYAPADPGQPCGYVCRVCPVQALIDALPDAEGITADNRAGAEAQLAAIDEARVELTDEETGQIDFSRYQAAVSALSALDGQAGADVPMLTADVTVSSNTSNWTSGNTYVVNGAVTINNRIEVTGTVTLRLTSGTLTANKGIHVPAGASLTIEGTGGALVATGEWVCAGIGGNNNESAGAITIIGGKVTATGGQDGAGIGGGACGSGGTITIRSGSVNATGGARGAGIGGGSSGEGGVITISGGTVTATGTESGAGIGGGVDRSGGTITITGGNITAMGGNTPGYVGVYSGNAGAGVGGGSRGAGGTITISGGSVTATGGNNGGAGIGGGRSADWSNSGSSGTIHISGGFINATGGENGAAGIGGGYDGTGTTEDIQITGGVITATGHKKSDGSGASNAIGGGAGTEAPSPDNYARNAIVIDGAAKQGKVYGNVTLTADFTISQGVTVTIDQGSTLTIGSGVTLTNNGTINGSGTITGSGSFAGTKLTPVVTNPTAISGLTYNGGEQALSTAGSTAGGTLQYSTDNSTWGTSIPTGTNAGNYTVYYKVVGNSFYNDVAEQSVSVQIAKADNGITNLSCNHITYGVTPSPTATATFGTPIYTYSNQQGGTYGAWSTTNGVGTWYVKASVAGTTNYNEATATASFQVTQKQEDTPNVGIDYGEEKLTGLEAGASYSITPAGGTAVTVTGGTVAIQEAWFGKTLSIVRTARNSDYSDSEAQSLPIPARPGAPSVQGVNETYSDENDGKITGTSAAMEYGTNGNSWTNCGGTSITNLAPGTYYVRTKAVTGQSPAFVSNSATVTIQAGPERTYTLEVAALMFTAMTYGYTQPAAQAITITSSGNSDATISSVTVSGDFSIGGSGSTVAAASSITSWTVQPNAGLGVGTHTGTITVTYNNGATATAEVSFTVNKAPLTPSATASGKTYDGTADTTGTISLAGAVNGETPAASGTFAFENANAGTGKTVNVTNITLTGEWGANYQLSSTSATTTANITPKSISGATVTLGDSLTYTGHQQAQTVSSVTINGMTITYTVSNNQQTNVGTYTLTVTGSGNFTDTQTAQFTIAKASNGITGLTCDNIVFGGTPNPTSTATFGLPTYTYSNEQGGTYGPWNTSNSKGTWYVKASVAEADNYNGAEAVISFQVTAQREETPNAGIDYGEEKLSGLEAGASYSITPAGGTEVTVTGGTVAIQEAWFGKTLSIVRKARNSDYSDSEAQNLSIPARPNRPTVQGVDETFSGESDGQITGTSTAMEYGTNGNSWTDCGGTSITNLAPGTYYVRTKAVTGPSPAFASGNATVTIQAGPNRTYTLEVVAPMFAAAIYGYTRPAAQAITITSKGNSAASISSVTVSGDFSIGGSGNSVTAGNSITTWTVQPNAGLDVGTHTGTITVTYNNSATATDTVSFMVSAKAEDTPSISISYQDETLTGFENGASYTINGEEVTPNSGMLAAVDYMGQTISIVRTARDANYTDSSAQSLSIPARPAAPSAKITVKKTDTSITITNKADFGDCEFSADRTNRQNSEVFTSLTAGQTYPLSVRAKATSTAFASASQTVSVTTTNADGSTTVNPGESVVTGGGTTITNDGVKITITGGGTTTTITPATEVAVGAGGGVTVPNGGTVQTGDGPEVKLPQGGTIGGNSEITVPGGGTAQVGNDPATIITVPEGGGTIKPKQDGTVDVPGGSTVQTGSGGPEITVGPGNGGKVDSGGNITVDSGGKVSVGGNPVTIITPSSGGEVKPNGDGTVTVPSGSTVQTGNGTEITIGPGNSGKVDDDGGITIPGGGKVTLDGSPSTTITLPPGGEVTPTTGGGVTVPDGGTVQTGDGPEVKLPDGGEVKPDGTTTTTGGGKVQIGGTTITPPPGSTVTTDKNGGTTIPSGSTVQTGGNGPEIKLPEGGTMSGDGNITVPDGGTVEIGDITITPPNGGEVKPNPDGTVTVPDGTTVQPGGGGPEITVGPGNSGTVGENGGVTVGGGESVQVGDTTITLPSGGGTVNPTPDGNVTVPGGSTVTKSDGTTTTIPIGGTVNPSTGEVTLNVHTVTFDSLGGSSVSSRQVPHGQTVAKPTDPTKSGYVFGGWYKESRCTTAWNFDTDTVTGDMTLYAKWTVNSPTTYTVTFDSQGGSTVSAATVPAGGKVTKPANPTKSGYVFGGWYKESGCTTAWNFGTDAVTGDMTLYAKWTVNSPATYTVTFDSQGGSAVSAATVSDGGKVTKPADPTKSGYAFGGWYKESRCTTAWNFDTDTVTGNLTLYAKWTVNSNPGGSSGGGSSGGGYTPSYSITPPSGSTLGGKVQVSSNSARPGSTVTITVSPDKGYELVSLTVTDRDGKEIELSAQGNEKYTFKMPNGKVSINATFQPITAPAPVWTNPFSDVDAGAWYYEAVRYVQANGLMNGYSDGAFGPNDQLSRAQLAQILFNKEGRPVVNYLMQYGDVATGAWYAEAIRWATSQGIVGGYGSGMFGPDDSITREQLAVMLWRYIGSPAATNKELHFNDTDEISGYALEALRWAVENGIISGYGDERLGPKGQATRAQVAQMLKNFLEDREDED